MKTHLLKNVGVGFGVAVLATVIAASLGLFNVFVLVKLWGWFVVPTFNAPSLSIVAAYGLMLIAILLLHGSKTKNDDDFSTTLTKSICAPLFLLAIGWIVKGLM